MLKKLEPLEAKNYSRTPIRQDISRDVQSLNPPDLRVLRPGKSQISKSSSFFPISPILTQKDKIHQKFKSEYNAFMNKFEMHVPFEEGLETKNLERSSTDKDFVPTLPIGESKPSSLIFPTKHQNVLVPSLNSELLFSPKESSKTLFLNSLSCLEESSETIPLSRKQIDVWDDGTKVPYKIFRQGPKSEDSIIFVLPPEPSELSELGREASEDGYLFIGYSKKQLYDEYMLVGHDSFFILDIIEEESYIIPMHQIVRILENSHVTYLVEKCGPNQKIKASSILPKENGFFSIIKPCKFKN
jgi:hypothetical protein